MSVMGFVGDVFDFAFGWLVDTPEPEYRGTELTKAATDDYIKKIYGTARQQGGTVIFKRTNDADNDDIKNDLLHLVIVWSEHVSAIPEIYIDDVPASSNNPIFLDKNGNRMVYAVNFPNGMDGYTATQLNAAGWRDVDKCLGKACSYIVLEAHKGDNAITSEPRLYADLTGTASSNPAVILKDYLKDIINGKGLTDAFLNLAAFNAVEAFCDSQVETYPGSGEYRDLFTCNIALDTSQTILQNTNDILRTFRGLLPILDGKLTPIVEKDDPPVSLELLERDIDVLGTIKNSSKRNRFNRVVVTYYDRDADGTSQDAIYPQPDSATDIAWLAADNGQRLEKTVDLKGCDNYYEAVAFAKILAEISREQLGTTITIKGIWATLFEVGDIVNVTHSFPGWDAKPFRILSTSEEMDEVKLVLREHQPYIYDYFGDGNKPTIVDTNIDNSPPAAPTNLQITHHYNNFKQVTVSWVSEATRFDYEVLDQNGNVLESERIASHSVDLDGYELGTYTFRVSALGGLGRSSGWAEAVVILQSPGVPTDIVINAGNFELEALPELNGADSATAFDIGITEENATDPPTDLRGPVHAYTFYGRAPNKTYKIWARSRNALGVSEFITRLGTTTNNNADYVDFVGGITLPGLPQNLRDTINGVTGDINNWSQQTGQLGGDYSTLLYNVTEATGAAGANTLDIIAIKELVGTTSVTAQITEFKNVQIGYEDPETGDWVEGAAFAQAFDEVRIENSNGSFLSVAQYFEALETTANALEGRIYFGIETYNSFTGLEMKAGESGLSQFRIFTDNLIFAGTDGSVAYQYSAALDRHVWYGARVSIGGTQMSVEDFDQPFGPDDLVYWRGPVTLNLGEPDLSLLTKASAAEWRAPDGEWYIKGKSTIAAPELNIVDNNGNPLVEYDTQKNTIKNYGTFYAANIIGGLYGSINKTVTQPGWVSATPEVYLSVTVAGQIVGGTFDRILKSEPLRLTWTSPNNLDTATFVVDVLVDGVVVDSASQNASVPPGANMSVTFSMPAFLVDVPGKTTGTNIDFRISSADDPAGSVTINGQADGGVVNLSVFKTDNSLS